MSLHVKIAVALCITGLAALLGWKLIDPLITVKQQAEVSDAGEKGSIHLAVDGWVGYFPLCSPEMRKRLNRAGYSLRCTDDSANYTERFAGLKNNDYQFVVATVDSYLLNAHKLRYPGPIIAVLDESRGGDAIVSRKTVASSVEDLKTAQSLRITYTPHSPSHHLLKAVTAHFGLESLDKHAEVIEAADSREALSFLKNNRADVAILWEPDVSRALTDRAITRILGTEDTRQLIVDVLIASQKVARRQPTLVSEFMQAYFDVLRHYRTHPDQLARDLSDHYDLDQTSVAAMLKGVSWASLTDNAERWFGVGSSGQQALIDTIDSTVEILIENRDFDHNPIPDEDPYLLTYSGVVETLYERLHLPVGTSDSATQASAPTTFAPLTDAQWNQLVEVGALKSRQITFASGTSRLTLDGKKQIDALVQDLAHYPAFRVEIRGHTGLRGDKDANRRLSQERADAVLRHLEVVHGQNKHRFRAIGYGAEKPLPRRPGESARSYNYRLPRVEIVLVREDI